MSVHGVDVSSYQSNTFDTKGLAFAFVKATEGLNYVSAHHAAQVAHARAAGLVVGHYHYGKAGNGAAQADYFLQHAGIHTGDILAFDWEDGGVSQAERDAFIKRVKSRAPGHKVVLYCNTSYWKSRDTENFAGDGLWIADPNHPAGHPNVSHPWVFHQYSWSGGIDHNVANFRDAATLRAWAYPQVPKPPAPPHKPVTPPSKPVTPPSKPAPTVEQRVASLEARVKTLEGKAK